MATYTAFCGSLRPGIPGSFDGETAYYPIYADVLVLDSQSKPVMVQNGPGPWQGFLQLSSVDSFAVSDTLTTMRQKVLGNLRNQYPQIKATDTIRAIWMDDGGLLAL